MVAKNNTNPTLMYINFPIKEQKPKNNTTNSNQIQNSTYETLKLELEKLNPTFIKQWEKIEHILFDNWNNLSHNGTLYIKVNTNYSHYLKVILDELLGRKNFLNEIIWVHSKANTVNTETTSNLRWSNIHDTIFVYVKNKNNYIYNLDEIDREPYMAPELVTKEKAEKGKLPTDTWWYAYHDSEEKIFERILKASTHEKDTVFLPLDRKLENVVLKFNRKIK